ncbi:MAG: hypothetical protein ACJ798_13370 [Phenylobacterium sp.]
MPSNSFERGGQPRSVPDPDKAAYDEMIRRSKMLGDREFNLAEPEGFPDVGHPGVAESLVPVWGSGREALADLHDGDYPGAAFNGVMAASDVVLLKALIGGLAKGGLKMSGPYVWRNARKEAESARQWLGRKGFLKPNQPGHHWAFEQKGPVPDQIKNQPLFVHGMEDAVQHGRVHGPYTVDGVKLPRFNMAQRYWYGTPDWSKAWTFSAPAHGGLAAALATKPDEDPSQ